MLDPLAVHLAQISISTWQGTLWIAYGFCSNLNPFPVSMLIHLPAAAHRGIHEQRQKKRSLWNGLTTGNALRSREESCVWRPSVGPSVLATLTLRLTPQGSSDFHENHSRWAFHAVQNKKTWSPISAPPCLVLNSLWTQRYRYRRWLWQCLAVLANAGNWYSAEMTNDSPV